MVENILHVKDLGSTNGTFVNGEQIEGGQTGVIESGDLVQFAEEVYQVGFADPNGESATIASDSMDMALAAIQFNKLIDECAVVPFFQPIVELVDERVFGYEVLGRSRLAGLSNPAAMFRTASKFSMEAELSRLFRREGMSHSLKFPIEMVIFLNTHPVEIGDQRTLQDSLEGLREQFPENRIILEIHEAAATNCSSINSLKAFLSSLDIGLAYDDFGAGQARLKELVDVSPDILKFDMSLIKNIHLAPERTQNMIRQLVKLTSDLGVKPLAEGVECFEEHEKCLELGFQYGQGYYYGRPGQAKQFLENPNDTTL